MKHQMKLREEPFYKIKNGVKTIELRLWDEKRQKIKCGDEIEFCLLGNGQEKLLTRVVRLHRFNSFESLYKSLPHKKMGYPKNDEGVPTDMNQFYSKQDQDLYGVVGIEIELQTDN